MAANTLCDDWACPAGVSCAHHLGRSEAYAKMEIPEPEVIRREREADAESCADYRCDRPKMWLLPNAHVHRLGTNAARAGNKPLTKL
ncbi:hypothetical protein [Azospirillum sp. sgz302134]